MVCLLLPPKTEVLLTYIGCLTMVLLSILMTSSLLLMLF
ncbi:hypothetical protein E1A91_D13G254100v1 [Gossypium mustelinum]|uniref:Uncharacterized protein n=1 Tax=Gossypium mustelinum TaxID=34275 RepID=A0A5D2S7P0_GOSMU|nr:hypothetical protein E1A91_D13G254100v1 [Gossypium mustelinum]